MSFTIDFTPAEEADIEAAAQTEGIEPTELLKSLVARHLPDRAKVDWQVKLRQWQEQEGVPLLPNVPAEELFSRLTSTYNKMTEAEQAEEDHLWEDVGKAILSDFIIATTNPGHLSRFVPCDVWTNIKP